MGDFLVIFGYLTMSAVALYFAWWIGTYDKRKAKVKMQNEISRVKSKKENYQVTSKNIKFGLYGNLSSDYCVITNDSDLIVMPGGAGSPSKIYYGDILDMKIDIHTMEKNVRRIIAFTSTYDRSVSISQVGFKLITSKKTYTVYYTPFAITPDGEYKGTISDKIDDTERFKLIVEKEISKTKSNNNLG